MNAVAAPVCTLEGCQRPVREGGLCSAHLQQQRRLDRAAPQAPAPKLRAPSRTRCEHPGCQNPMAGYGFCEEHQADRANLPVYTLCATPGCPGLAAPGADLCKPCGGKPVVAPLDPERFRLSPSCGPTTTADHLEGLELPTGGTWDAHSLREAWLRLAALYLSRVCLGPLPILRVTCGWTSKGAKSKAIGECWTPDASDDKATEIFISPKISDSIDVAAILAHELVHAVVGIPAGHGPQFAVMCSVVGLQKPWTATTPTPHFRSDLAPFIDRVGPYPHAALTGGLTSGPKKQAARMLKISCAGCGYTVRAAKKWIDVAVPECPNPDCTAQGDAMEISE